MSVGMMPPLTPFRTEIGNGAVVKPVDAADARMAAFSPGEEVLEASESPGSGTPLAKIDPAVSSRLTFRTIFGIRS